MEISSSLPLSVQRRRFNTYNRRLAPKPMTENSVNWYDKEFDKLRDKRVKGILPVNWARVIRKKLPNKSADTVGDLLFYELKGELIKDPHYKKDFRSVCRQIVEYIDFESINPNLF